MAGRAAERREQLVRAGYALLGGEGAAATTMRAVCREAGLSLRYFYENFADREALLIEIYDRTAHGLVDAVTSRLSDIPVDDTAGARAAFDAAAQYFADDPRRGRIMFRETLADDTLRAHGADALPAFVTLVATRLAPERAARFTATSGRIPLPVSALSGALVALFLNWLDGDIEADRDQVVDYATHLTVTILELA